MIEVLVVTVLLTWIVASWVTSHFQNTKKPPQLVLKTFRYDNIWYQGEVQAEDIDEAVRIFNHAFRISKTPLVCHRTCLKEVVNE